MENKMKTKTKVKQIVIRFDQESFDLIREYSRTEHRGIGEFVRHAALDYVEKITAKKEKAATEGGG